MCKFISFYGMPFLLFYSSFSYFKRYLLSLFLFDLPFFTALLCTLLFQAVLISYLHILFLFGTPFFTALLCTLLFQAVLISYLHILFLFSTPFFTALFFTFSVLNGIHYLACHCQLYICILIFIKFFHVNAMSINQ